MDKIALMNLMDKTDKTLLRCIESGVEIPEEWISYRQHLRAIITTGNGDPPTAPPYPAGT